ncbi:MAG: DEAD/DEAH box helicase, partial [Rhizobium sp.]|nr:DEAD/DEAH box helicase [Rhizobium sp.]
PMPAPVAYSYAVPDGMAVEAGSIVQVPLGPRQVIGVVWDGAEAGGVDPKKLRSITKVFDCPPLDEPMRAFLDWVATYTLSPPGYVARMALRAPAALDPEPMVEGFRFSGMEPERMTPARRKVLELAGDGLSWTKSGLAHASGVSASVIDGLAAQGVFETVFLPPPPLVAKPDPDFAEHRLAGPQKEAAEEILAGIAKGGFSVALIDGVTGSGKTEVYFEAIAETLRRGKQVLILLPEIALTANFLERFQDRFGAKPGEWHSDLATRTREKVWRQAATGEIRVVAGARSALLLPFEDLGLIVVDEEHDPAFKQEDRVFYNARDMAVVRARIAGFPVVVVLATPWVVSQGVSQAGRYKSIQMTTRIAQAAQPDMNLIDMSPQPPEPGGFIYPHLQRAVGTTKHAKEHA